MPQVSVIISTYNQPEWLRKVLVGYQQQINADFEVIIADDGSTEETKEIIDTFKKKSSFIITHVRQEDNGFQKTKILNKAILASKSDYLIITDGDCIPRKDFVFKHTNLRQPNCFLSGGYFKLPKTISELISDEDIEKQFCFDKKWLLSKGLKSNFKLNKLTAFGFKEWLLNTFTPTKATWDGMNASGWKTDVLKVNGFDERMQYGGEDREFGERLMNLGIKPIQIRYSAICVHLCHNRGYKNEESIKSNQQIRNNTRAKKIIKTPFGIEKLEVK